VFSGTRHREPQLGHRVQAPAISPRGRSAATRQRLPPAPLGTRRTAPDGHEPYQATCATHAPAVAKVRRPATASAAEAAYRARNWRRARRIRRRRSGPSGCRCAYFAPANSASARWPRVPNSAVGAPLLSMTGSSHIHAAAHHGGRKTITTRYLMARSEGRVHVGLLTPRREPRRLQAIGG